MHVNVNRSSPTSFLSAKQCTLVQMQTKAYALIISTLTTDKVKFTFNIQQRKKHQRNKSTSEIKKNVWQTFVHFAANTSKKIKNFLL